MKKLTIIMPIYNSADTLERALDSIVPQLNDEIELVIIDGGSKDNTKDVIGKYKQYIDYFKSEPDQGYADALNKGIKVAKGKYITMLAADDYYLPHAIKNAFSSMKDNIDIWCGALIRETIYGYTLIKSDPDLTKLYKECSLRHPATLFKREVLEQVGGYDINYKCGADRELFLRLYTKGYSIQTEEIPMVLFTTSGMSETSDKPWIDDMNISIQYGADQTLAKQECDKIIKYFNGWQYKISVMILLVLYKLHLIGITSKVLNIPMNYMSDKKVNILLKG